MIEISIRGLAMRVYESVEKLIDVQKKIAERALDTIRPLKVVPKRVAGLDAAYSRTYGGVAVAVLVDFGSKRLINYSVAVGEPRLEYIPGLLAFREAPLLYTALQSLEHDFDLVVVDGHGISHPRKAGIATHIGLALGKPSIGVAKKRLYGNEVRVKETSQCIEYPCTIGYLVDENGYRLAYLVIPNKKSRAPVYISPGAGIDLNSALRVATEMMPGTKLPLPTHYADRISKHIARQLDRGVLKPSQLKKGIKRLDDFILR